MVVRGDGHRSVSNVALRNAELRKSDAGYCKRSNNAKATHRAYHVLYILYIIRSCYMRYL
jgi:hypothetical protein